MKISRNDPNFEAGANLAAGALYAFAIIAAPFLIAWAAWILIANTMNIGRNNSEKDGWHRSGMEVLHDYKTGRDYLAIPGAITPRLPEQ